MVQVASASLIYHFFVCGFKSIFLNLKTLSPLAILEPKFNNKDWNWMFAPKIKIALILKKMLNQTKV